MPLVDQHGRVFSRFNVIDFFVVLLVVLLVPVGYGSYLLFRPATPRIESVTQSTICKEELRLAGGTMLSAKLKVRGAGFNPMLRARIGNTPALGFVFEDPTSADVILGSIPAGTHDLVLYDGVQEVARAAGAVTIETPTASSIRIVGWLVDLEPAVSRGLGVTPEASRTQGAVTIVELGPEMPGRERVNWFGRTADVVVPNRLEREAVIDVPCDPRRTNESCGVSGVELSLPDLLIIPMEPAAGILRMAIAEVLPAVPPTVATITVRFTGASELRTLAVGDRDAPLDQRAAVVETVSFRGTGSETHADVTLRLGIDASRDGWRYRGHVVAPGTTFRLSTDRYVIDGAVESILLRGDGDGKGPM